MVAITVVSPSQVLFDGEKNWNGVVNNPQNMHSLLPPLFLLPPLQRAIWGKWLIRE